MRRLYNTFKFDSNYIQYFGNWDGCVDLIFFIEHQHHTILVEPWGPAAWIGKEMANRDSPGSCT